jgi:hypothetical protein
MTEQPKPKPDPVGQELSGRIGKYEIVRSIGKGAMGMVYLAHDTVLERDVALKVMVAQIADDPELIQRFAREAKAVAKMTHPNVVTVFDLGTHIDGSPLCLARIPSSSFGRRYALRPSQLSWLRLPRYPRGMFTVIRLLFAALATVAHSRLALAAEILALRHQLGVLKRARPPRLPLSPWDRALWAFVLRRWTGWKDSLVLVKPGTVIAWHRRAFRLFWRRRSLAGRPTTRAEIRRLIRQMALENST